MRQQRKALPPILGRQRSPTGEVRFDDAGPTRAHVLNGIK